jgi:hypothetical protein
MKKTEPAWTVPVALDDVPDDGRHMVIEAPAAVRAEIAKLAGLRDLPAFSAAFDLARKGSGLHVSGLVKATVGQTCVVTLEPIESSVEEPVDLLFASATAEIGHDDGEPPEPLINGRIDLGALATEFLLLGIDPYPRKAGAEFAPPKVEDGGEHPFAALAPLKTRLGSDQS